MPSRTAAPLPRMSQRMTRTGIARVWAERGELRGVVGAAVVDDEDLERAGRLTGGEHVGAQRLEGAREPRRLVQAGMTSCMSGLDRGPGGPDQLSA